MTDRPRIVFIGSTLRGYKTLLALLDRKDIDLVGVISLRQDKHETARFEKEIRAASEQAGVPCHETKWMKDKDYVGILQEWAPDVAYLVGCRILIPESIYSIPRIGSMAIHDSLLPEYRGFAPMNWAILNGESTGGVTMFYLDDRMDGGDIALQREVPIGPLDTAPEVYDRICDATIEVIHEFTDSILAGDPPRTPQDYSVGSFTCSRTPADGMIDWTRSTREIHNLVRALTVPYPGAYTYQGTDRLRIWNATPVDNAPEYKGRVPGRVIQLNRSEGTADVLTGDGILRIHRVQKDQDEEPVAATTHLKSVRLGLGLTVPTLLSRIEALEARLNPDQDDR